ncbi:DUF6192 family protein [Streptomyces europaeiscabiei]|uniref:DUF6192 family protein n=1 Tax=Streptomyces europaeiscabiei TaxID=146819 RepID=UPI0029B57C57|nr:DUF6192 family protein [Streptomyces europaeiscabiei]MDX3696607.1 DUF6192 family protein [Streptomyces europaeiscabiei]
MNASAVTRNMLHRPEVAFRAMTDDTARHRVNQAQVERSKQAAEAFRRESPVAPAVNRTEHAIEFLNLVGACRRFVTTTGRVVPQLRDRRLSRARARNRARPGPGPAPAPAATSAPGAGGGRGWRRPGSGLGAGTGPPGRGRGPGPVLTGGCGAETNPGRPPAQKASRNHPLVSSVATVVPPQIGTVPFSAVTR